MDFFTDNIPLIVSSIFGSAGGGLLGVFFERRKNKALTKGVEAEADSKEIDNSSKVVSLYKSALDDLENRYEKKYQEITSLYESKIKLLNDEIRLHKRYVNALKKENTSLRKQLKDAESNNTK